jgi:hypothetical protein
LAPLDSGSLTRAFAKRRSVSAVLLLGLLGACGTRRLETLELPAVVAIGGGSSGTAGETTQAGTGGTAGGGASAGGTAGSAGTNQGGIEAMAGEGSGGAPEPLETEELISLADFPATIVQGPANAQQIDVTGEPFTQAWKATMSEPPSTPWVAQLIQNINKPVAAGQLMRVSFWLRCDSPGANGDCYTEFIFERAASPWEKSVTFAANAGTNWTQKSEYFSAVQSYAPGESHAVFRLGYADQVIEIGGFVLERIGPAP